MNILKDLKIRQKLILGFGIVLFILTVISSVSYISFQGVLNKTRKIDSLLNEADRRATAKFLATKWAYPVFNEFNLLIQYLQTDDIDGQRVLFKKFEETGKEFESVQKELEVYIDSEEEKDKFRNISNFQQNIINDARKLIAIRDGEAEYGLKTKEGVSKFFNTVIGFITQIDNLSNMESQKLKKIQDESKKTSIDAEKTGRRVLVIILVALIIGLGIGIGISYLIGNSITVPVTKLVKVAKTVADGDLTGESIDTNSQDELGSLTNAIAGMKDNLHEMVKKISEITNGVTKASEGLSSSFVKVMGDIKKQGDDINRVATTMEEMSATVLEVAKSSSNASTSANQMSGAAEKGGQVVEKNVEGMKNIANITNESKDIVATLLKSSGHIGEVIKVIDDIADQTNLLALNAAIEAARAGEHGRGFAVVADEVRKLAEKTIKATKEIAEIIKNIQKNTLDSVNSMKKIAEEVEKGERVSAEVGGELRNIVLTVKTTADMINQIATATEEQSAATEEVSNSITNINSRTQEISAAISDTMRIANNMESMASDLKQMVRGFRV